MKNLFILTAVVTAIFFTTPSMATDVGIGYDRETKYNSSGTGTTTNLSKAFVDHKWKQLFDLKTKFTHMHNMDTNKTKFNEFKLSKDFKLNLIGDKSSQIIISPAYKRRWDGQFETSQDNFVVEMKFRF